MPHHTPVIPFKRATQHSRSRSLTVLALLGCTACGPALGDGPDPDEVDEEEDSSSIILPLAERKLPAHQYSEEELDELAHSAAVTRMNTPFQEVPNSDASFYVTMSDGVRLAVALYLPRNFDRSHGRAPVVFVDSLYSRAAEAESTPIKLYQDAGFIVMMSDSRGFGASFGYQSGFLSSDQRRDQQELVDWIRAQPWSNGKVTTYGISLSATTADLMTGNAGQPLDAAILRNEDFDQYRHNILAGGIPNPRILGLVEGLMSWMRGDACVADLAACAESGFLPVAADGDLRLLQSALSEHQNNVDGSALSSAVFIDDVLGTGRFSDMSAADNLTSIRQGGVPARVTASWLDGVTALGALERFNGAPELPMEVSIGAATHLGGLDADPFSKVPFTEAHPAASVQYAADIDFVRRVLDGQAVGRKVDYYVLGADVWKSTPVWPPQHVERRTLQLSRHSLVSGHYLPKGERRYRVDPNTASGAKRNRWASQTNAPIFYGDQRSAPGQRLSFDTAPLARDTELVGAAELCLSMRSDQRDGIVVAYLEDVAPDGRVTYLTEGELRLLHRKTRGGPGKRPCDPADGVQRSFERKDGEPVVPGELMQIELPLLPTAALIRKGHRLRLSLSGADAGTFPMLTNVPATWSVGYGRDSSFLILPLKPWSNQD